MQTRQDKKIKGIQAGNREYKILYMGIWSHERYISIESEVRSLQSTCLLKASVDCRLPTSDSIEIYLS